MHKKYEVLDDGMEAVRLKLKKMEDKLLKKRCLLEAAQINKIIIDLCTVMVDFFELCPEDLEY